MPIVGASKIAELSQAKNPKIALLTAVGDLSKEEVLWDLVLIGTYIRPEKTSGGVFRPIDNIKEDEYQGKTGLVLKLGNDIADPVVNVGDWVVYSIKDGWAATVNGVPCRLVPHDRIRMKVTNPDMVF